MDEDIICSTQDESDAIEPINRQAVHLICSGQVVLSLAIAVKELVENAIDAGATIINIHLKEYGADLIEVSDNGKGVEKEYFKALALKHYTSKIKKFEDLASLHTLGFRGEALSSLCALSNVTILTKHVTADYASLIKYDQNGHIINVEIGAREQGTTVSLQNLFLNLPVRRKEFMKNLKREFNKMCQLLHGYCLVSKGIKFTCSNSLKNGGKTMVMSTEGSMNVKDNIINLFTNKQLASLIDVDILRPTEEDLENYRCEELPETIPLPFSIEFLISSVVHGNGRGSSDRQFFYINSRPCEFPKLSALVNHIYRQFNKSQYPFVYLNVITKSLQIDVNITPDKRKVFLEKENILLATVKTSLMHIFKTFLGTYQMNSFNISQSSTITDFFDTSKTEEEEEEEEEEKQSETDNQSFSNGSILERFQKRPRIQSGKGDSSLKKKAKTASSNLNSFVSVLSDIKIDTAKKDLKECRVINKNVEKIHVVTKEREQNFLEILPDDAKPLNVVESLVDNATCHKMAFLADDHMSPPVTNNLCKPTENLIKKQDNFKTPTDKTNSPNSEIIKIINDATSVKISKKVIKDSIKTSTDSEFKKNANNVSQKPQRIETGEKMSDRISIKKSIKIDWTMEKLREAIKSDNTSLLDNQPTKVRFRTEISPKNNKPAEQELQKHISKDDFVKMDIIGQFNHGFIITKLENDLFVIDQHASDEKYNFEQLQANTVMETQVLVRPKPLELTAANECLLIDNLEVFNKNGFQFKIDESAPCTKKVSLLSVPLSKNTIFGKDDIDQMLFMLQETNYTMVRPSRIRDMFASRACRSSVMVGKALSIRDMRRLVDHMSEIDQPWNCPHGRPTMRHLINLDLIDDK